MSVGVYLRVQPRRDLVRAFARWAVEQRPKVGTCELNAFSVPAHLFGDVPSALLEGALVEGQPWQPPEPVPEEPGPRPAGPPEPVHHEPVGHACPVCGKEFSTLRGAAVHERMKHGGGRGGR